MRDEVADEDEMSEIRSEQTKKYLHPNPSIHGEDMLSLSLSFSLILSIEVCISSPLQYRFKDLFSVLSSRTKKIRSFAWPSVSSCFDTNA